MRDRSLSFSPTHSILLLGRPLPRSLFLRFPELSGVRGSAGRRSNACLTPLRHKEARAQERRFLVLEESGEVHIRSTPL
jgi:hypothetical protein